MSNNEVDIKSRLRRVTGRRTGALIGVFASLAAIAPNTTQASTERIINASTAIEHSGANTAATKKTTARSIGKIAAFNSKSSARPLGTAMSTRTWNADARNIFTHYFNSLTPENELKWEYTEPQLGTFDFTQADKLVKFAADNHAEVRGHALLYPGQDPPYVKRLLLGCDSSNPKQQAVVEGVMNDHITTEVNHFKEDVHEWDVVNEPATKNSWQKCLPNYIELALHAAHAADPTARLFINEYDAEFPRINGALNPRYIKLRGIIKQLVQDKAPIDGVGLQTHAGLYIAGQMQQFGQTIDSYTKMGLKVRLTEVDVARSEGLNNPLELQAQRAVYRGLARACGTRPGCAGMTVWGVDDKASWQGADRQPLLFDANDNPKQSYDTVRQYLNPSVSR